MVFTYVITASGLPVYLHYCGGQLEKISYVTKGKSCCGDKKSSAKINKDCCKDKHLLLKNSKDFTLKQVKDPDFKPVSSQLFYVSLAFINTTHEHLFSFIKNAGESPPPRLQNSLLVSVTVMRI